MSRLVAEACDFKVSIPMRGRISSLNASNAAAILLYEAVRQRGVISRSWISAGRVRRFVGPMPTSAREAATTLPKSSVKAAHPAGPMWASAPTKRVW